MLNENFTAAVNEDLKILNLRIINYVDWKDSFFEYQSSRDRITLSMIDKTIFVKEE